MSAVLEEPQSRQYLGPAQRLRRTMAAARVSIRWLGVHKTLSSEQKAQAAESFGAEGQFLSAGKKLIDTRHPAFKAVTAVKHQIRSYWKGVSLPFPEPGIRLIRQDSIETFDGQMNDFRYELEEKVGLLDDEFAEIKDLARQRLGSLYNQGDYPASLRGLFAVEWDFPSVEPPDYLRQLSPELYEQERIRIAARFDEAVQLAEQAFAAELASLISHLSERLSGQEDGKPKIFRDSVVENLLDFFARFRQLNVRSNEQLDELVAQAQRVVSGVQPQQLRESADLRQHVALELNNVQSVLDGLMVDRPRRNILRRSK